jgi:hypothetical protein
MLKQQPKHDDVRKSLTSVEVQRSATAALEYGERVGNSLNLQ